MEAKLNSKLDHITPLGFKNDGYDYTQHLKEMGTNIHSFIKEILKLITIDYNKVEENSSAKVAQVIAWM